MRREGMIFSILLFIGLNLFGQGAKDAVLNQFNMNTFASNVTEKKPAIGKDEELSTYNLRSYEYVLEPEKHKSYKEYQAVKLDGLSNRDIVVGMLTHSLNWETRYVEIKEDEKNLVKDIIQNNKDYVFISEFEKQYFITPEGEYKYIDGREIVGSKSVRTYLEKGKPITVASFYFAMRKKGIIDASVNLRTFISMSLEDQIRLLNLDIYASAKL